MSRGLGPIQRFVLERLDQLERTADPNDFLEVKRKGIPIRALAKELYGEFTPAQWSSIRQGVRRLVRQGRAEITTNGPRGEFCVRLPYTEQERQAVDKEDRLHYTDRQFGRKYGLPPGTFIAMLDRQDGLCAICLRPERAMRNDRIKRLALDHDHKTGKLRDLLCGNCNNGLGRFDDDPVLLRAAADYIERHRRS